MKVFVYGTLKKGFRNQSYLKGAKYLEKATMKGKMYDLGGYPCIELDEEGVVYGEVYEIDKNILANLDRCECYPRLYTRSVVDDMIVYHLTENSKKRFDLPSCKVIHSGVWEK